MISNVDSTVIYQFDTELTGLMILFEGEDFETDDKHKGRKKDRGEETDEEKDMCGRCRSL